MISRKTVYNTCKIKKRIRGEGKMENVEKVEVQGTEENVVSSKGSEFNCGGCGKAWTHKVKNTSGLCKECVEVRRAVRGFLKKGMYTKAEGMKILRKIV